MSTFIVRWIGILLLIHLTGCGGGAGSEESTPVVTLDQSAPTVTINFPIDSSVTVGESVIARGTVSDASEVAEIKVNGASVPFSLLKNKRANTNSPQQSDDIYTYSWQAELAIQNSGNFDIRVSTTDIKGNSSDNAAQTSVFVPLDTFPIEYDEVNNTFIGWNWRGDVSIIDPADNTSEKIINAHPALQSIFDIFKDTTREKLISVQSVEDTLKIYTMELSSGSESVVKLVFNGTEFVPSEGILLDASYSVAKNTLALSYISYSSAINLILEFNFSSNSVRTLLSRNSDLWPKSLAYVGNSLFVASGYTLEVINLETLVITDESDLLDGQYVLQFSGSDSRNALYGISWEKTFELDLNSRQLITIAQYDDNSLNRWSQPSRIWMDQTRNRLLVTDFDAVIAVDLNNGKTNKFYSDGRGKGYRLSSPRVMDISSDDQRIYVFDDGGNSVAAVFVIDVDTGDRNLLTKVADATYAHDIVLDEANNRLFLLTNNRVWEVHLSTGELAEFASNDIATGVYLDNITAMVLDSTKNILYVTDVANSNIISIDLETKVRTIISSPNNDGGLIDEIKGVTINSEKGVLYVLGSKQSFLYQIDIETGNRVKILDSCMGVLGDDILTEQTNANRLFYSDTENAIYIYADTLLKFDLNSKTCSPFGGNNKWPNLDIKMNSKNQIFSTFFSGIRQVDFDSGSEVIISKY